MCVRFNDIYSLLYLVKKLKLNKMNKDEKELWENVQYRMDAEGFHYCFDGYSSWEDIQDEEFHRLRLNYLQSAKLLEAYINNKKSE
jgi:hypothetical protein